MIRMTACILLSMTVCAFAQTTQPTDVSMKAYDVSDLVRATQDFPAPRDNDDAGGGSLFDSNAGLNPTPRGVFRPAEVHAEAIINESLRQLIVNSVDPQSWTENGGLTGAFNTLGSVMLISQTQENHEKVAQLLKLLREAVKPDQAVCVRAYWLTLSAEDAAKVMGKDQASPKSAPVVPEELMASKYIYCQAQTTCFNGQAVYVFSGRQKTVIVDQNPVVGTDATAFDPQTELRLAGVQLEVRPKLSQDGGRVVLDLSSVITEREEGVPSRITEVRSATSRPVLAEIDREDMLKQQMQTTVTVPVGKKVLVGGMTIEPSKLNGQQLYLVIEASPLAER
jgi:hypothetical protein